MAAYQTRKTKPKEKKLPQLQPPSGKQGHHKGPPQETQRKEGNTPREVEKDTI